MATEILGFLIIVGILIVFIVRRDLWNGTSSRADEVEEASVKMRLQMEHSANAIITQMDSRIHQLEGLVTAADERARMLEQQLATVRADQERAQQQAEKAFAEMRAVRTPYYGPQEEMIMPSYRDGARGGSGWSLQDEYRARAAATGRSLRPIEGVSSVRRSEYIPRVRPESRDAGEDFAETLSASMYAEEARNDAYRRPQTGYYGNGQSPAYSQAYPRNERYMQNAAYPREETYDARDYEDTYEAAPYPVETYPEEDWDQYVEQPRRTVPLQRSFHARRAQAVPAEMAVEETPAVIVDSHMVPRQDAYVQEEPEDEEAAFSSEQLEELAQTEAEVLVSSSVEDVVDLPMAPDEEEQSYDDEEDEDVHAFVETDENDETILTSADEEPEFMDEDESSEPEAGEPGRFEEQDLFGEEDEPETSAIEETSFAVPEEDFQETEEAMSGEGESYDGEDEIPSETEDELASFEPDEDAWDTQETGSAKMPVDTAEVLAGGMNETLEEEDYDTPEEDTTDEDKEEEAGPRPSSSTIQARALLAQGIPPEEVAKRTGMGRSAVELLAQMAKGMLNPQDED